VVKKKKDSATSLICPPPTSLSATTTTNAHPPPTGPINQSTDLSTPLLSQKLYYNPRLPNQYAQKKKIAIRQTALQITLQSLDKHSEKNK
jgi:hypothetical protein